MSQSNPILGANLSGLSYRSQDNNAKQALLNHHKGSSAPSYAEAGIIWLDDNATPWKLKFYDGADWITLGEVNTTANSFTPYLGTSALLQSQSAYIADTGSANAYAIAPSPSIGAYATGQVFFVKPANTNTGASTINVNGLGAKSIKMLDGTALPASVILASGIHILMYDGTNFVLLNPNSRALFSLARGTAIASASTVDLGAADSDYIEISGTTTITSLGSTATRNHVHVKFQGALTLTHNGTSLILPTAANITTAAGDTAEFVRISGSNWQCLKYHRANGNPLNIGTGASQIVQLDGAAKLPAVDGSQLTNLPGGFGNATETSGSASITLTSSSNRVQNIAMTAAGKFVKLPDATTLTSAGGVWFIIKNTGSYFFPVIDNAGQAIALLQPGDGCMLYCSYIGTAKGRWYAGTGDMGNMTEILNGITSQQVSIGTNGTQYGCCATITDTTFLFTWYDSVATASIKCAVISITDADTLSAGSAQTVVSLASLSGVCCCPLDSTHVFVGYHGTSNTSGAIVTISGTSCSPQSPVSIVATTSGNMHAFKVSSSVVFCGFVTSTTSKGVVLSVTGNSFTTNGITTCRTSTTSEGQLCISQADANTYFYATVGASSYLDVQLVTVSGTAVTANTALANNSSSTVVSQVQCIALSTTLFLVCYSTTANTSLHIAVFRISTGTTLELWSGGNAATGNAGDGFIRTMAQSYNLQGMIILNNYAVLITSEYMSYPYMCMYFFKFNATTRAVSFSHMTRGDYIGSYNPYARPAYGYVSPGKYAFWYGLMAGTQVATVCILHGITNP